MKRLFISQPMRDKTDEQILAEREKAVRSAKEYLGEEVEVIDTFYTDFPEGTKPLESRIWPLLMLPTLRLDGMSSGDVRSSTCVQWSMEWIGLRNKHAGVSWVLFLWRKRYVI